FGFDPHALHVPIMAWRNLNANAGNDLVVAVEEVRLGLGGQEQVSDVTRAVPLRGAQGVLPLAALHDVTGAPKRRDQLRAVAPDVPAAVVEMQVRVDDDVDVLGSEPVALEAVEQRGRSADVIDVRKLSVELVANTRLNQDVLPAGPHQQ